MSKHTVHWFSVLFGLLLCFTSICPAQSLNFYCLSEDKAFKILPSFRSDSQSETRMNGDRVYTFTIAISATAEFTTFHGGMNGAMIEIINSVDQLNSIFGPELAIQFELLPNNHILVFTDSLTDPFSSGDLLQIIQENQNLLDVAVGNANYDIGLVYDKAQGGGVTYFNSVCVPGYKGQCAISHPFPAGNSFTVDYVAHEIGHMFGAHHTHHNPCQRHFSTAYEPGSGSTIMAYAGICPPNLQSNSDPYFHGASIDEIRSALVANSGFCSNQSLTGNQAPQVSLPQNNISIPANTPFSLTGTASDPDGDSLYYCWEQFDLGGGSFNNPVGNSPIFRSFLPVSIPDRTIPQLGNLLTGTSMAGEILPGYDRQITFRFAVRDRHPLSGGYAYEMLHINVDEDAGPFEVTGPTAGVQWNGGRPQRIEWERGHTHLPPIDASTVSIWLSLDGGLTFPIQLADQIPNNGLAIINLPNVGSNEARLKIAADNHIFFCISPENFTIVQSTQPTFSLFPITNEAEICEGETACLKVLVTSILGFQTPVQLSLNGLGNGSIVNFSSNPITPGDTLDILIQDLPAGKHELELWANSLNTVNTSISMQVYVDGERPPTAQIMSPLDGDNSVEAAGVVFSWSAFMESGHYLFELANRPTFGSATISSKITADTSFVYEDMLAPATVYYWRVHALNHCDSSQISRIASFKTLVQECQSWTSGDVPVTIPVFGAPFTLSSSLNIPLSASISDVNVQDLEISHSWISDLTIRLKSPNNGPEVILLDRICGDNIQNMDLNLDDEAYASDIPCPPTSGGYYQPFESLGIFRGIDCAGSWRLQITDHFDLDGGSLDHWGLEICYTLPPETAPELIHNAGIAVDPGNSCTIQQNQLQAIGISSGPSELIYTLVEKPEKGSLLLNQFALMQGDTFSQADINDHRLTYQHNGSAGTKDLFSFTISSSNGAWMGTPIFEIDILSNTQLEVSKKSPFQIYPNPAGDWLRIQWESPEAISVQLYDLQAKALSARVLSETQQHLDLDLSGLMPGVYLLHIRQHKQAFIQKVIVRP